MAAAFCRDSVFDLVDAECVGLKIKHCAAGKSADIIQADRAGFFVHIRAVLSHTGSSL